MNCDSVDLNYGGKFELELHWCLSLSCSGVVRRVWTDGDDLLGLELPAVLCLDEWWWCLNLKCRDLFGLLQCCV